MFPGLFVLVIKIHKPGIDAPTTAQAGLATHFFRWSEGVQGGNGEKCQPSGLSAEGGNDSEFRQTTSGAHGCAGRADRLPRGKPPASGEKSQLCRMRTPAGGMTRRLRRGSGTYRPMGRSHFSFGGERKVCKRKPAARRLREKGFYCPF